MVFVGEHVLPTIASGEGGQLTVHHAWGTSPFLPRSGTIASEALIRAIQLAPGALHAGSHLQLRTMLIRQPASLKWVHLATTGTLGSSTAAGKDVTDVKLGTVRILGNDVPTEEVSTIQGLLAELSWWHGIVLGEHSDTATVGPIYSSWYPSRNAWTPCPCWVIQLTTGVGSLSWDSRGAEGPFLNRADGWCATDLSDVGRRVLGYPGGITASSVVPQRYIILSDSRGWIDDIRMVGTKLTITSSRPRLDGQFCTIDGVDLDGESHKRIVELEEGIATVDLGRTLRGPTVHLFTQDEQLLDRFEEHEHRLTWDRSVLQPQGGSAVGVDLTRTLENGEGETVEFKEWIPLERHEAKSRELLDTIVAFGNAKGGTLLIGVNDYGVCVGTAKPLMRILAKKDLPDLEARRDSYVKGLQKAIAEGVSPHVSVAFRWRDLDGQWVLQLVVKPCADKPCCVTDTDRFLVRKGATNRMLKRPEFELMFRRSRSDDPA